MQIRWWQDNPSKFIYDKFHRINKLHLHRTIKMCKKMMSLLFLTALGKQKKSPTHCIYLNLTQSKVRHLCSIQDIFVIFLHFGQTQTNTVYPVYILYMIHVVNSKCVCGLYINCACHVQKPHTIKCPSYIWIECIYFSKVYSENNVCMKNTGLYKGMVCLKRLYQKYSYIQD